MDNDSRKISSGAMCDVYLSYCKNTDHKKIIKVYPKEREQFYQIEKEMLCRYKIINFPALIDSYADKDNCYIEVEYIDGETLYQHIKDKRKLKRKEAVDIIEKLIKAIAKFYLVSENKYIIGDLSPQNIILRKDMELSIVDLNSVCERSEEIKSTTVAFCDKDILNNATSDAKGDIYSIGMLYLFMLTGSTRKENIFALDDRDTAFIKRCMIKKDIKDLDELQNMLSTKEKRKKTHCIFKRSIAVIGSTELALEMAYASINLGYRTSLSGEDLDKGLAGFYINNHSCNEIDEKGNEDLSICCYSDMTSKIPEHFHFILVVLSAYSYDIEEMLDSEIINRDKLLIVFFKYDKKYMISKAHIVSVLPDKNIFFINNTKKRLSSYETGYERYIRRSAHRAGYLKIIKTITGE